MALVSTETTIFGKMVGNKKNNIQLKNMIINVYLQRITKLYVLSIFVVTTTFKYFKI